MTGTFRVDDKRVLAAMQNEGALGPVTRIARTRRATLDGATEAAYQAARSWWVEGYNVESVLVTLRLARSDDFEEE